MIQDYKVQDIEQQQEKARQVTLDHIDPMCSLSLSSMHIGMHALILLPKPHTLGFGFILG
jgi:hypothetical protein